MGGRRGHGEGSIHKRSDGRWAGVVDLGWTEGKRRRKTVYGATQAECREKLRKLLTQLETGAPPPDDRLTVGELMEQWLSSVVVDRVTPNTFSNYSTVVKHHIVPTLGRRRLTQLSPIDVQSLLRTKLDAGLSPRTVRLIRGVLVQAIRQAERWELVGRNVATLSEGPRLPAPSGRSLTAEEAHRLVAASSADRLEALYLVMLSLGLRRGEALGLPWSNVDFDAGLIRIGQALKRESGTLVIGPVKTSGSRRTLNAPEHLVALMRTHRRRQHEERLAAGPAWVDLGLVFTTPIGTAIDPSNFGRYFDALCTRAGIGKWHPHELRHSAASIMLAQGVPLEVVSDVLGHASIRITKDVYGHIAEPQRRAAAEAMDRALWGTVEH